MEVGGCSDHELVELSITREGNDSKEDFSVDFRRAKWAFSRKNPMGTGPAWKRGARKLDDNQRSVPSG